MKKIILALLTLASITFANECRYEVEHVNVGWEAYKTPLKIGVGGTFDKITLKTVNKTSQKSFLQTSTITIDTSSIDSKNSGRDAKLVKYFFDIQNVNQIIAKVVSVSEKIITVDITMNGITKTIPMRRDGKNSMKAQGNIDLGDFNMLPSLSGITKACFDKHQGKTWQDVTIRFELQTRKYCN